MVLRAAFRSILAVGLVVTALVGASSAAAAAPLAAPPASQRAIQQCGAQAAASAATADVERVVSGIGAMSGCITDATGIAHLFVDWAATDGPERGRICVDPPVASNVWSCQWDTTDMEPGSYVVTLTAIDAAGNRGTSEQAYRVEAPRAEQDPAPQSADPAAPSPEPLPDPTPVPDADPSVPVEPPVDPTLTEPAPAEPLPVEPLPAEPTPTTPEPDDPATPETLLEQLVADRVEECARLELAPDVLADRALSVAVLECMRPAFEGLGATELGLDEIPVPPAMRIEFGDAISQAAADELLPERIGGVELQLVVATPDAADAE